MRKPIQYVELVDVRFSDLDMYGHVNSKHYIDMVSTARLVFLANKMKVPIEEVTKRGIGFFMTKSTVNYKKPINGLQKVLVQSHVREVKDEKLLIVPFTLSKENGDKLFADGEFEFMLIDMNTNRTTKVTPWLMDLFLES
jgi:YbgC/YbaW family acyl-CoA thioester hydrolase